MLTELEKAELDIARLRSELVTCYDILTHLDDEALDKIPESKLIKSMQAMTEAEASLVYQTTVDRLVREKNEILQELKALKKSLKNDEVRRN